MAHTVYHGIGAQHIERHRLSRSTANRARTLARTGAQRVSFDRDHRWET
jgi:hypothetical protein